MTSRERGDGTLMVTGDERGAGTLMVGVVSLLVVGLSALGVVVGAYLSAAHRARASADLSVLAAAHAFGSGGDGCRVAAKVARANSAEVVQCRITGTRSAFAVVVVSQVLVPVAIPGAPTTVAAEARAGTPAR